MNRAWISLLFLAAVAYPSDARKEHRDYVPDRKTAERIAEAVLISQYGEGTIHAQMPLLVDSNKEYWIVQVSGGPDAPPAKGGGPAVWINKHSGCLQVMDYMK